MTNNVYDKNLDFVIKNLKNMFLVNNLIVFLLIIGLKFLTSIFLQISLNIVKIYNKEITIDWTSSMIYKEIIVVLLMSFFFLLGIKCLFSFVKYSYNILEDLHDTSNNIEVVQDILLIPTRKDFNYLIMNKKDTCKKPKTVTSIMKLNKECLNKNSNIVYFKHTKTIIYLEIQRG